MGRPGFDPATFGFAALCVTPSATMACGDDLLDVPHILEDVPSLSLLVLVRQRSNDMLFLICLPPFSPAWSQGYKRVKDPLGWFSSSLKEVVIPLALLSAISFTYCRRIWTILNVHTLVNVYGLLLALDIYMAKSTVV